MLALRSDVRNMLQKVSDEKGITIQELLRAVIVPDWFEIKKDIKEEKERQKLLWNDKKLE